MARNIVTVELIDNSAVRRDMTLASVELLKDKWRIVGQPKEEQPQKKSDVIPAEGKAVPTVEEDPILNALRGQYKAITGKDAKGKWKGPKIQAELKKLETA